MTPTLSSERLVLRPLGRAHVSDRYVRWMNDREVNKYLESGGDYTIDMLKNYLDTVEEQQIYFWAIHLKEGKHIGNIKIDPINVRHRFGEYGILMGDREEWGKGYAKEASELVVDFCFNGELRLRKVILGVVRDNVAAVKLYEKLGFVVEGTLRSHVFHVGKWCDLLRMSLFAPKIQDHEE